jgi:hypothetical protein
VSILNEKVFAAAGDAVGRVAMLGRICLFSRLFVVKTRQ